MSTRLVKAFCVLALSAPLAFGGTPPDSQNDKAVTQPVAKAESGTTTVCHSVHDWQPGSLSKTATRTVTEPASSRRSVRGHRVVTSEPAQEVKP